MFPTPHTSYLGKPYLYLLQDAVDRLLVHFAGDRILPETSSHGPQVVQRGHPQSHLCLLVTELVHLKQQKRATHQHLESLNYCNQRLCTSQDGPQLLNKHVGKVSRRDWFDCCCHFELTFYEKTPVCAFNESQQRTKMGNFIKTNWTSAAAQSAKLEHLSRAPCPVIK